MDINVVPKSLKSLEVILKDSNYETMLWLFVFNNYFFQL